MYFLYFLVWIIFNGQVTLEIVLFGLVIAAAVYWFSCKFIGWSIQKDLFILKKSWQILKYVGLLLWEIIKANMTMIMLMISYKNEPSPVLVRIHTKLQTKTARVVLANSITLTPGTITVLLEGDELMVHCLDKSLSQGLENSSFEQALLKIEGGAKV
ncbi:MAG: Na+/H+ antiporter subunit E [Lachnospiraceae bacterium]|nr:Na+/H+ antiporter subunit E [Lachnospiraceae bacterium]